MLSSQLPKAVDVRKLARRDEYFKGILPISLFEQLVSCLAHDQGSVRVGLHFFFNEQDELVIKGDIESNCQMICQRCLEVADFTIHSEFGYIGVRKEAQLKSACFEYKSSGYETLLLSEEPLLLAPLIEEELLLSLPIVPYHPINNCCAAQSYSTELKLSTADLYDDTTEQHSPFGVLTQLKLNSSQD